MDPTMMADLARRALDLIEARSTDRAPSERSIATSTFFDPARAALEREVLEKTPVVVAHSTELVNPGDYVTTDLMGTPVLVVRQEDGSLSACVNVCRHRGSPVVDSPSGCKKLFACPFHGWTYNRDGTLRSINRPDGFTGLERADFGLIRLPIEERHGLVWVIPAPGGNLDLRTYLGETVDEQLGDNGMAGYTLYRRETFEVPANWKAVVDGFTEVYHIGSLHSGSIAGTMMTNVHAVDYLGEHARLFSAHRDLIKLRDIPTSDWDVRQYSILTYQLLPATAISNVWDHFEVWTVLPHKSDPKRAMVTAQFLIPEPITTEAAEKHWDRNWNRAMDIISNEDWDMAVRIQRCVEHSHIPEFILGRNEPVTQLFHKYVDELVDHLAEGRVYQPDWIRE